MTAFMGRMRLMGRMGQRVFAGAILSRWVSQSASASQGASHRAGLACLWPRCPIRPISPIRPLLRVGSHPPPNRRYRAAAPSHSPRRKKNSQTAKKNLRGIKKALLSATLSPPFRPHAHNAKHTPRHAPPAFVRFRGRVFTLPPSRRAVRLIFATEHTTRLLRQSLFRKYDNPSSHPHQTERI
jgi:hypothetical protein